MTASEDRLSDEIRMLHEEIARCRIALGPLIEVLIKAYPPMYPIQPCEKCGRAFGHYDFCPKVAQPPFVVTS